MRLVSLIIDTDKYAGNFEREMCAYITGQIGDCCVGDKIVTQYANTIKHLDWWNEHILNQPDENDIYRPVSIYSTPNWFNNGYGKDYQDTPENEIIALEEARKNFKQMKAPFLEECLQRIKTKNYDVLSNKYTEKFCNNFVDEYNKGLEKLLVLQKYPSYQSVAIFTDETPPKDVLDEFYFRAYEFVKNTNRILGEMGLQHYNNKETINITNFRQN